MSAVFTTFSSQATLNQQPWSTSVVSKPPPKCNFIVLSFFINLFFIDLHFYTCNLYLSMIPFRTPSGYLTLSPLAAPPKLTRLTAVDAPPKPNISSYARAAFLASLCPAFPFFSTPHLPPKEGPPVGGAIVLGRSGVSPTI